MIKGIFCQAHHPQSIILLKIPWVQILGNWVQHCSQRDAVPTGFLVEPILSLLKKKPLRKTVAFERMRPLMCLSLSSMLTILNRIKRLTFPQVGCNSSYLTASRSGHPPSPLLVLGYLDLALQRNSVDSPPSLGFCNYHPPICTFTSVSPVVFI